MWFQFKMSKSMWIISVLILIMMVSSFWFAKDKERPWVKCKESLFAQVVFKQCTPSSFATPEGFESMIIKTNRLKMNYHMNHLKN